MSTDRRAVDNRQARKAEKLKKRKRKFKILLAAEIIAVLLVSAVAFIFFYLKSKYEVMNDNAETFEKHEIQINEEVERNDSYRMVMLYGVDARNNHDVSKDANADTDIIACINNETGEVKLVSVLRDTYLQTTRGKYKKLTDVYSNYGVKESIQTINRNLDLAITEYVSVNWKGLIDAINILDGVDIEVTSAEIKQINKYGREASKTAGYTYHELSSGAGMRHLDGAQAVGYARIRNVTVNGEGHDIARATRQRKVINEMLKEAKKADLSTLKRILNEVLPEISTNISFADALDIATNISKYKITETGCYPYDYKDQSNLTTAYVYCDTLSSNNVKLHQFLFGNEPYTPSKTVETISEYIVEYRHAHP